MINENKKCKKKKIKKERNLNFYMYLCTCYYKLIRNFNIILKYVDLKIKFIKGIVMIIFED